MNKTPHFWVLIVFTIVTGCQHNALDRDRSSLVLEPFESDEQFQSLRQKVALIEPNYKDPARPRRINAPQLNTIQEVVVTAAARTETTSITNNQVSGVDEGDIVKQIDNLIIVLRRGRLFSFSVEEHGNPQVLSFMDLTVPENPYTWYDEMLVHGHQIIVIGYSYDIDATLLHRINVQDDGSLFEKEVYVFDSEDYYDGENYPTRLVENTLHFYMPRYLVDQDKPLRVSKIVGGKIVPTGNLLASTIVYKPLQHQLHWYSHNIVSCPLEEEPFRCSAKSVIGAYSNRYYFDHESMYLWINAPLRLFDLAWLSNKRIKKLARRGWGLAKGPGADDNMSVLYKIPLGDGLPTALAVTGRPLSQFSFHATDNILYVLTTTEDPAQDTPPVLWKIPQNRFSRSVLALDDTHQIRLPALRGEIDAHRFIGDYLLYSDVDWYSEQPDAHLMIKKLDGNLPPITFTVPHHSERIEQVGQNAVVIGENDSGLGFTSIGLASEPWLGATTFELEAATVDSRSHAFNYTIDTTSNGYALIGFPTITHPAGYDWSLPLSLDMQFHSLDADLNWWNAGTLQSTPGTGEDWCRVSCTDWYGTARPFFLDGYVYALMGYELIGASVFDGYVIENARANGLDLVSKSTHRLEKLQN